MEKTNCIFAMPEVKTTFFLVKTITVMFHYERIGSNCFSLTLTASVVILLSVDKSKVL